jgi:hypothetical protein
MISVESVSIRTARLLAMILAWSVAATLMMGYFFSPIGAMAEPDFNELADFACAFTITGAVAASVTLMLEGKMSWAVEIALSVALTMAATAVLAYVALWAAPWTVRSRMDAWSFLRLQHQVLRCGKESVCFPMLLGVGVGAVVGAIMGKLTIIARRRPRLAGWLFLGLLVTCASGPVRPILFDLVFFWGLVVPRVLASEPMTQEHVWATAAIFGAVTGTLFGCLSIELARRHC